jgi:hypothetical protein
MQPIADQVKGALESADPAAYAHLLDPNVHWGAPGDQQVLSVRDGLVVDIVGYHERTEAAGAAGIGSRRL